jgi:murein DD-endopeptidase MepM/ murein hydrolase activator NlpD
MTCLPAGRNAAIRVVLKCCLGVVVGAGVSCSNPTGPDAAPTGPTGGVPGSVNCSLFPDSRTAPYVLPFAIGERFQISRTFDHYTPGNGGVGLYAIDVPMPVGTPVHAIRAGTVVAVEERFPDTDHATFHENWVMIRHADGTVARYIHLTANGALVETGNAVAQGQRIGLSGNSGASTAPHLHFDVQTCGPNLPPGYNDAPCGMTVPLSFRNTEAHACGLEARRTYAALPFESDSR